MDMKLVGIATGRRVTMDVSTVSSLATLMFSRSSQRLSIMWYLVLSAARGMAWCDIRGVEPQQLFPSFPLLLSFTWNLCRVKSFIQAVTHFRALREAHIQHFALPLLLSQRWTVTTWMITGNAPPRCHGSTRMEHRWPNKNWGDWKRIVWALENVGGENVKLQSTPSDKLIYLREKT